MPPPETCKSEIGSQPTMCQVNTGAYFVRLAIFPDPPEDVKKKKKSLTTRAWKNRLYRLPPKEDYHVYVARSTYHYAYARQTQVN